MKKILFLTFLLIFVQGFGQEISGVVREAGENGKPIPFAKLDFVDLGQIVVCDEDGKWSFNYQEKGIAHVHVEAVGFERKELDLDLSSLPPIVISLNIAHHHLDKVLVSNDGLLQREKSITNVETHDMYTLKQNGAPTLGEAIENISGVNVTNTGAGISKPVIRGLSGARVLTYVNGLRIENQQWGADHGLPIADVGVGGVEVIKGPASLLYGADALGGVIYFVDEPFAEKNNLEANVQSSYYSSNLMTANKAGIKWSKEKFKLSVFGGYDNAADYTTPSGLQVRNSRFRQQTAKVSMGYNSKNSVTNFRYIFYSGRIGLPGHTHDSIIDVSSFLTTTQNRTRNTPAQVLQNHFAQLEHKLFLEKHELTFSLGNTNNRLMEHEEKITIPDINVNLNNSLFNLKWKYQLNERLSLTVGSQNMVQFTVNDKAAPEQLTSDSRTIDMGGYVLMNFKKGKWRTLLGGRFDRRNIAAASDEAFDYSGFNFSAGFNRIGKMSDFRLNVSSGFRAPTVAELLNEGVHHGSNRYEIGNPNLVSERAFQLDGTYALHLDDLELIINPYFNVLNNYVISVVTDSFIDSYQVFEYQQIDNAILYGADFGFHYHPHHAHWLHLETSFSTVFSEDLNNKNPLPNIPATSINSQIRFDFDMNGWFQLSHFAVQHKYYFAQPRVFDLEIPTGDYHIVNTSLNALLGKEKSLSVSVGCRNILNTEFIPHLSNLKRFGLPDLGINGFISISYNLKHKLKKQ